MADTPNTETQATPKKKAAELPLKTRFYTFAKGLAAVFVRVVYPISFHNLESVQAQQAPFVLIGNHQHWSDPVVLAMTVKKNQVTFLGKKDLVKNKLIECIFRGMHMITVDRHQMDMGAMRSCTRVLRDGGILGIFPEGTRYHTGVMEEIEEGTALLTMRANVPLVPVYIDRVVRPLHRSHAYVGTPIGYDDLRAQGVNRETCEQLNQRIRDTYAAMKQEHPFQGNLPVKKEK